MESHRSWRRFRGALTALVLAASAAVTVGASPAMADAAGQGGDFVPLGNGVRIVDTANGIGTTKATRGPASTTAIQVLGVSGIPATGVRALLVDVATKAPSATTYLTLWAGDVARPNVTTLYANAGEQVSNSAVVEVGANGKINLFNFAGNTNVFIDVQGYFTTNPGVAGAGGFVSTPTNPTVASSLGIGIPDGPIAAGSSRTFSVLDFVPAGTPAIFADVVVATLTAPGYLLTGPAGATGGASSLEFTTGVTSSGTSIRPAANGDVTITNKSTGQITVQIRLQGYFTVTSTEGAGLRPKQTRLFDTVMAANSTVDVPVGGTNGLPLRGIAGAAISFNAGSTTESGYFKAWPLGDAEPKSTVAAWPADKYRSGLAIVKPGTDGKIRVKNVSNGTVHLYADLQGWFADLLPTVPPATFSPTSVLQASPVGTGLGAIEYSYVDNIGRVRLGHQTNLDDNNSVQWSTAAGTSAFSGQPGMSQLSGGKVQVTAQNQDSDIWSITQTAAGSATYGTWSDLGGSMSSTPTQVTLSNNVTVVFAVDVDGKLWHYRPVTSTSSWRSLGDQDLIGPVTTAPVALGVQLFARDTAGAVRTALYTTDGSISAWTSLGGAGVTDRPAVVVSPGDKLRVFVRAADGTVQTKARDSNGSWAADWSTVGTFSAAGAPAVILDPVLGRIAVVARNSADNEMYRVFEAGQGTGTWGDWARLSQDVSDPAATDPTVAPVTNSSGQSWVIVFRNANDATRVYERQVPTLALRAKIATGVPSFIRHTLPTPPS